MADTLNLVVEPNPPQAWIETVERGLRLHNTAATGIDSYYPVGVIVKNGEAVVGGLFGNVTKGWLHVGSLWIEQSCRGRGYGTELMAAAERYALAKGGVAAFLQTGSYEARPLYEKLGYEVFAELADHPVKGHRRYFLAKRPLKGIETGSRRQPDRASIVMQPYASQSVEELVHRGIQTHAIAAIGLPEQMWQRCSVFLKSDDSEIVGGAIGNTWGRWLYVSDLWIDSPLRGTGHGASLMQETERQAVQRGCTDAFLDTFSFQARPFYEKLGYKLFGTLEDHPLGHSHYYMKKRLSS
jgi:GNAT superfamily N-acetyltransferase